jgi:hypothetical protein
MSANRFVTEGMFVETEHGELVFDLYDHSELLDQQFLAKMIDYKLTRHGACVFIYGRLDGNLVSIFKPFDNTQLICDPRGFAVADVFGGKRFLIGAAQDSYPKENLNEGSAITCARDLAFSLSVSSSSFAKIPFKKVTLHQLLTIYKKNEMQLYHDLTSLFLRCADCTPGKMSDFTDVIHSMCRFNLENSSVDGVVTDNVFLLDKSNKIIGTMSSTVMMSDKGEVTVYFYDEVVDYFTLLSPGQTKQLLQLKEASESKGEVNESMREIIEPRRSTLMAYLFVAARVNAMSTIQKMRDDLSLSKTKKLSIRAFIRAAEGRVENYQGLGCGKASLDMRVIHGPSTTYSDKLSEYIYSRVEKKFRDRMKQLNHVSAIMTNETKADCSQQMYAIADLIASNRGYGNVTSGSLSVDEPVKLASLSKK